MTTPSESNVIQMPRQHPLSVTHTPSGFTIERRTGNELFIYRIARDRKPTLKEAADLTNWYWAKVGTKGNDPAPEVSPNV